MNSRPWRLTLRGAKPDRLSSGLSPHSWRSTPAHLFVTHERRKGQRHRPAPRRARAARFLEPAVSPRAGAGVRAVRPPQGARETVPAEPVQPGVRDLAVRLARAGQPPQEAREPVPAEPPVGAARAVAPVARVARRVAEARAAAALRLLEAPA